MIDVAAETRELYEGKYRHVLSPNLHERQMRAAYVGVYKQALAMGLAEVAARSHAARIERRLDHQIRTGLRDPIVPVFREDEAEQREQRNQRVFG